MLNIFYNRSTAHNNIKDFTNQAQIILGPEKENSVLLSNFSDHIANYKPVMDELISLQDTAVLDYQYLRDLNNKKRLGLLSINNFVWNFNGTSNTEAISPVFSVLRRLPPVDYIEISTSLRTTKLNNVSTYFSDILSKCKDQVISSYPEYSEFIVRITDFLNNNLTINQINEIVNFTHFNEKIIVLLVYPYFFKPLGSRIWAYFMPIIHKTGNMLLVLKDSILRLSCLVKPKIYSLCSTISVKRVIKFVGFSGTSLLAMYSGYLKYSNTTGALISVARPLLYEGMSGAAGHNLSIFRTEMSKVIYDLSRTASTLSGAAIAGLLEPKSKVVQELIRGFKK